MENVLRDFPKIQVQKLLPSYVNVFAPEPQDVLFLHRFSEKSVPQLADSPVSALSCASSPDFDVTGSPLKLTMYSLRLDDTVVDRKKCWSDEEENHLPVPLRNARTIISRYLIKVPACDIPLWIVCDGLDPSKTLLVSGMKRDGWCSRTIVCYGGQYPLSVVEEEVNDFGVIAETKQVNSSVSCVFSLHEENCFDKTIEDGLVTSSMQNCSKMLVELKWHHACLKVPFEGVSAILAMDLNIGHVSSLIYPLWGQWNFVQKYFEKLHFINSNKKYVVPSSTDSSTELSLQNTSKKILNLIKNPENVVESLSWEPSLNNLQHRKDDENILTMLVRQVADCARPDCDVTDKIWVILNEVDDICLLTDCLNIVLSELGDNKSMVHANMRKNTLLASTISAHIKGDIAATEISSKTALEIMIETGIEKLKQDYIYIFKKLGVECSSYFKNISPSITKSLEIVKYNIILLAQLHIALDFILAAHFYLSMSGQRISSFAENVFNKCCQKITSFDAMGSNSLVSLEVPVNFECVSGHIPNNFLSYKLIKSSKDKSIKDYSILLLSSLPIFPPSIFQPGTDNSQEETENTFIELQYYVYKLSCWCDHVESNYK